MQIPVKQMKIAWNQCLWGFHIENFLEEKITFAEAFKAFNKLFTISSNFFPFKSLENLSISVFTEGNRT